MYEREKAQALQLLGYKPTDIIPPDQVPGVQENVRRLVHILRQQHGIQRANEAYYARAPLSGWIGATLFDLLPPVRSVRDLLEEALIEAHLPGRAIRGLHYKPWNVIMDFAFPATRLCLVLDDAPDIGDKLLMNQGWFYIPLRSEDIRRDAAAVAEQVNRAYKMRKEVARHSR